MGLEANAKIIPVAAGIRAFFLHSPDGHVYSSPVVGLAWYDDMDCWCPVVISQYGSVDIAQEDGVCGTTLIEVTTADAPDIERIEQQRRIFANFEKDNP